MLQNTTIFLWLLLSLLKISECIWLYPIYGDTIRVSIDVANKYVYFEKIGDLTGYYGRSVIDPFNMQYLIGFGASGKVTFSVDPLMLGLTRYDFTITGMDIVAPNGRKEGNTVSSVGVYSFTAQFFPNTTHGIYIGFYTSANNANDIVTVDKSVSGNQTFSYSSCGECDCVCSGCFGPKNTQCNDCVAGHYMNGSTCLPCNDKCIACTGGSDTQCSSCASGYYLQPPPYENTCADTCPSGYYKDGSTSICAPCSVECATCTGGRNDECQSCASGAYESALSTCSSCASGCSACTGEQSDECTACSSGYFFQLPTETIRCADTCPSGYYGNQDTNTCDLCADECTKCTRGSSTMCQSCRNGYYLDGTACLPCATGCATCTGGDVNQCSACTTNYFLQPPPTNTICAETCPPGNYGNKDTNTCDVCADECTECTGGSSTQCLSCAIGHYQLGSACLPCATGCNACSGGNSNQCSVCSTGYYVQPLNSAESCSLSCPNGYFQNTDDYKCDSCAVECATCTGPSNTECQSCASGFYLEPNSTICTSCTTGCLSCTSADTCNQCAHGYHSIPGGTACVTTCPTGTCLETNSNSCVDCKFSCGDGKRMSYEECDDGNLINGDGCSSKCTVEENWSCQDGSPTNKDTCNCSSRTGVYQFGNNCVILETGLQQTVAEVTTYTTITSSSVEGSLFGAQLLSGVSSSMFATALNYLHVLMMLKYCNVGFPPIVEQLFISLSNETSSSSTDIFNIFSRLEEEYAKGGETRGRFHQFGIKAFFLSNIGYFFLTLPILSFVILLLNILKHICKEGTAHRMISRTILPIFQWNMTLSMIISAQVKLSFGWLVQFSNPFGNTYSVINFVIAIVTLVAICATYIAVAFKISWNWSIMKEKPFLSRQVLANALIKREKLSMLWKTYDIKSSIGRYFLIIQTLKTTLVVAIIFGLYDYPLAQCYLLVFLSIIYLMILGIGRPFKNFVDLLDAIGNEICLFLEEVLMAVFATNKQHNFLDLRTGNILGWVMIGVLFLCLASNIICILAAVIYSGVEALRKKRKKRQRRKAAIQRHVKSPQVSENSLRIIDV